MTESELVREIAQPLTDQSGDYDALTKVARVRARTPKAGAKRKRICHEFCRKELSECNA
jgi:hypothetical protein